MMMPVSEHRRGRTYVALAAVAWSTAGLLQRELTVDVPPARDAALPKLHNNMRRIKLEMRCSAFEIRGNQWDALAAHSLAHRPGFVETKQFVRIVDEQVEVCQKILAEFPRMRESAA